MSAYTHFERHFYRCADCLHVFALDGPNRFGCVTRADGSFGRVPFFCDCGSGRVGYMGKVGPDGGVGYTEERCACDSRCTSARGPKCNCVCGGANHGTDAVVRVRVDNTAATIEPQPDLAQRLAMLAEFRAARDAAKTRVDSDPVAERMAAGEWISDRKAWERVTYGRRDLHRATNLKTHAARMRAIAKVGVAA